MIKRETYLNEIKNFMNKPVIKVITGMRRSGKSMILKLISQELLELGVNKNNIIYINFESLMFAELTEFKKLYEYIMEKSKEREGRVYILLDEIQEVKHWEKSINSLMVDLDCDIYILQAQMQIYFHLSWQHILLEDMLRLKYIPFLLKNT